jgi:hypothetical protein
MVGVYRGAQKADKLAVIDDLKKNNLDHVIVTSTQQVDYINKEMIKILGSPNLSEKWWGKADPSNLEGTLS